MESRKRLGSDSSVASSSRPAKRIATDSDQIPIQTDPFSYDDLTFINDFRREAIYRTLVAERRETLRLNERLQQREDHAVFHDDHIRIIDLWLKQLLEELAVSCGQYDPSMNVLNPIPPTVLLLDKEGFEIHLARHRQEILNAVNSLYHNLQSSPTSDFDAQNALKSALAKNNVLLADISRLNAEKDDKDDRLTDTMMRLLSLEKKLDRSKSLTLAKIEAQATQRSTEESQEPEVQENGNTPSRPNSRVNNRNSAELENANAINRAALAAVKEECATLLREKSSLLQQLSQITLKFASPTRDDVEQTEVYKSLVAQVEHLGLEIARLESSSQDLREEHTALLTERTKYKEELLAEHKLAMDEANGQILRIERDLTRVRGVRDELHQEIQNRKAREDETLQSAREISEIADSREMRIIALEKELARYKAELETNPVNITAQSPPEELLRRIDVLEKQNKILSDELPALEMAFNKAHKQSQKKIIELVEYEEKLSRLQAEKAKAEQKYFSTMKSKDQIQGENRALKHQLAKTAEVITKVQEAEKSLIQKIEALERQLALSETIRTTLEKKLSESAKREIDQRISLDNATSQIAELKSQLSARIAAEEGEQARRIDGEEQKAILAVQLEAARGSQIASASTGDNSDLDTYRRIARCGICNDRWKDTAITLCGHVFCKTCVDRLIDTRQRRCPVCAKSFDRKDMLTVHIV